VDVVEVLNTTLARYEIDRSMLIVEITEQDLAQATDHFKKQLDRINENGYALWIDDFGSGYSSLNMLKDLPVNVLKIDLRFLEDSQGVENGRADNILSSIVRMAKSLDLPVIAEGVENQKQVDFLRMIGCEYAQGYFFSEPVPCEDYRELIKSDYVVVHETKIYSENAGAALTLSSQLSKLMEELRKVAPEKVAAIEKKMKEEAAALW
jgi:EAL domain-containing protein (putative c-di-GMP-specific phosphodiesterase class I)